MDGWRRGTYVVLRLLIALALLATDLRALARLGVIRDDLAGTPGFAADLLAAGEGDGVAVLALAVVVVARLLLGLGGALLALRLAVFFLSAAAGGSRLGFGRLLVVLPSSCGGSGSYSARTDRTGACSRRSATA